MQSQRLSLSDLVAFDTEDFTSGGERRFMCPFEDCKGNPHDDHHRTLSVNEENGGWRCYRCKAKGYLAESRPRGRGRGRFAPRVPRCEDEKLTSADESDLQQRLSGSLLLKGTPGEDYVVTQRGIPLDLAHDSGLLYHRSWFGFQAVLAPIHDRQGDLVAVSGRSIKGEKKIRIVGKKGLGVFATPGAFDSTPIVVTEAAFDSLTLHLCGLPSIALMGTTWPTWLPASLAFKNVLVALDDDAEGNRASADLMRLLRSLGATVSRLTPRERDWNEDLVIEEYGEEMLRQCLNAAVPRYDVP